MKLSSSNHLTCFTPPKRVHISARKFKVLNAFGGYFTFALLEFLSYWKETGILR
jgi:hypothetical protein